MSTLLHRTPVRRGAAVGAAAICALLLRAGTGGDAVVRAADGGDQRVGAGAVLVTSVLAGLAGWALLAVLERVTRSAFVLWVVVATVVFGLSLIPAAAAADGASSVGIPLGLHTIVYVVLTVGFWRTARSRRELAPA